MLILWFGSHVNQQVLPRHKTIAIRVTPRMHTQPQQTPPPQVEQTQAEEPLPEPEPVVPDKPEDRPAVVPEKVADEREKVVVEEEVKPPVKEVQVAPEEQIAANTADTGTAPPAAVMGTDVTVPSRFQYYIDLLEARVARNWHPKQLGFRQQSTRVCRVHFHVEQNGLITRETLLESSGVPMMDRESMKAVKAVGRFMPLPRGLADHSLGVTYTFTLSSGY